ncbi:hypothetical protein EJ08DRAFT_657991 [Tothia fuscella]|uniref:Vacuolar protein sorting-associated protein 51 homolog n=1 Tax=Tothia fuscella TaxID=1048955 RepID=A0A9P4NY92_9PEZI|nr:hypothetical protein EJ08DRAFT_657991 [Tothia fuscella]
MATAPLSPSPRPSLSIRSPPSSRTSLDQPQSSQSSIRGNQITNPANPRRNRAALRDYYNLKAAAAAGEQPPSQHDEHASPLAELDRPGFEAGAYVRSLLEREGLEGLLRLENELVSEVRGLDGERKALVYDNYSKLIKATDTIRKMRTNMDPLTPATSTLAPAISHIAETTASLSTELSAHVASPTKLSTDPKEKQRQTVRWVLAAPTRLRKMVHYGGREAAEKEWDTVNGLLDRWKGTPGTDDVRKACEQAMAEADG